MSSVIDRLERLDLPIFHLEGWYDAFTRGQLQLIGRLLEAERAGRVGGPNYAVVGPWNHGGSHFLDHEPFGTRLIEWYRHWLDDGPRPTGSPSRGSPTARCSSRSTASARGARRTRGRCRGRTSARCGCGRRARSAPSGPTATGRSGRGATTPSAGQGEAGFSKWDNAAGPPQREADQAQEDEWKGLTFSTPPLERDLVVTGPMELRLRAQTDAARDRRRPAAGVTGLWAEQVAPDHLDTDFVVKLERRRARRDVDADPVGLPPRVAPRRRRVRSRDGEPFHPHDPEHVQPVEAGEPTDYRIEVWPTSKRFAAGHRLRIALYSADTPNHLTLLKPVENTVLAGSHLLLPEQREGAVEAAVPPAPAGAPKRGGKAKRRACGKRKRGARRSGKRGARAARAKRRGCATAPPLGRTARG